MLSRYSILFMNAQFNKESSEWYNFDFNSTGDNWDEVMNIISQKEAYQIDLINLTLKQLKPDKFGGLYTHQKIELGPLPDSPNKAPSMVLLNIQEKFFLDLQQDGMIQAFKVSGNQEYKFDAVWDIVYAEFDCYPEQLISILSKKLKQKPNEEEKIKLSEYPVFFNDNESVILVGNRRCELPAFKNEFCLSKVLFSKPPNQPIDWSLVLKEITGIDPLQDRKKKSKQKKGVYDTTRLINARIKKDINTSDNLFTCKNKTIVRNF